MKPILKPIIAFMLLLILLPLPLTAQATSPPPPLADFEDGTTMGFDVRGSSAVLTATDEEAHSGTYSLLITERKQSWNGSSLDVTSLVTPGSAYEMSVWVLPRTEGKSTFILSTQIGEGDTAQYVNLQSKSISKDDGWTLMSGSYTYYGSEYVSVYVENSSVECEFYIDDFSFYISAAGSQDPQDGPITRNQIGTYDGFDFEFWSQDNSGDGSMLLTGGGTFSCLWDGRNILFRVGKKLGSLATYQDYGEIVLDYGATHGISSGDVSYLCVYGWTQDPLIEFYIIESHGSYKPPGGKGFQGTYELDDGTYEVYVDTRVQQPSIEGTRTFEQYFAVRSDKRKEGIISISDHFAAWDEMGLDMGGKMYEIALCVEGYQSSGSAAIYRHILTVGDDVYGTDAPPIEPVIVPEPEPPEPDIADQADEADDPAPPEPDPEPAPPAEDTPPLPTPDAADSANGKRLALALTSASLLTLAAATFITYRIKKKKNDKPDPK